MSDVKYEMFIEQKILASSGVKAGKLRVKLFSLSTLFQ